MARLVNANREKVEALCRAKGWGAPELAAAAIITVATAAKILRGQGVFRSSLKKAANALGKRYVDLLDGTPPEEKEEKHYNITLVFVGAKQEGFDEDDIVALADKLKKLIGGSGDIDMEDIGEGSVRVTFSLNEADFRRLLSSLEEKNRKILTTPSAYSREFSSVLTSAITDTSIKIRNDTLIDELGADFIEIDKDTIIAVELSLSRKRWFIIKMIFIAFFIIFAIIKIACFLF